MLLDNFRLFRHPNQPVEENGGKYVKANINPHEAKVPPTLAVKGVDAGQKDVGVLDRAELAGRGCVGVTHVPAGHFYIS